MYDDTTKYEQAIFALTEIIKSKNTEIFCLKSRIEALEKAVAEAEKDGANNEQPNN